MYSVQTLRMEKTNNFIFLPNIDIGWLGNSKGRQEIVVILVIIMQSDQKKYYMMLVGNLQLIVDANITFLSWSQVIVLLDTNRPGDTELRKK